MTVELLSIGAVFVGGCALLRTAGLRGRALAPLGFLAGVCLLITIGLIQVVAQLPTTPALTLALVAGLPTAWWAASWWRGRDVAVSLPWAGFMVAALAGLVVLLRAANLVKWHTDSVFYLSAGWLLAEGTYRVDVTIDFVSKRLLGTPLLHAPANLTGELYLRSVTPLLALATLVALLWMFHRASRGQLGPRQLALFGALGALVLVSNNRYVFSTFYLNGHLLFAAELLLIAGSGWLLACGDHRTRALQALQLVAVPAMIVTRPEGALVAVLALLPTWLSPRISIRHRAATMAAFATSTLAWHLFMWATYLGRDTEVAGHVYGGVALGALALAAVPLLRWRSLPRRGQLLLWLTEAALWLALLALAARSPQLLRSSFRATEQNLLDGYGRWGLSLVALGLLVLVALYFPFRHRVHLRFPLTTFAPLAFLLAYLRDEPYRVGYADSLSRMFMQYVPLALLFVVAALATGAAARARAAPAVRPAPSERPEPVDAASPG